MGIAACIWGIYAWQSAGPATTQEATDTSTAKPSEPSKPIPIDEAVGSDTPDTPPTTLPAITLDDAEPDDAVIDVDTTDPSVGGVRTTEPPSLVDEALDSTFGQIQPDQVEAAQTELKNGREALARGDFIAARTALSKSLDKGLSPADEQYARNELSRIADTTLFSRARLPNDPLVSQHKVVPGDNMAKIVAPFDISPELAARINQISNPQIVRLGATLKLIKGPFSAIIDKSDHRLDVYLGDIYVRSFNVGLGGGDGTPTGLWSVRNKLMNPEWIDPATGHRYLADAPDNPIGERWIGLVGLTGDAVGRSGFGIHGTIDAASIGRDQSMGCIRLVADDVAWVFDLLVDGKSRVAVRE